MKIFWKTLGVATVVVLLTVVTQTGGVIYLISLLPAALFRGSAPPRWLQAIRGLGIFLVFYLAAGLWVTPWLAEKSGRVPLPWRSELIRPANTLLVLANRHYVEPELLAVIEAAAEHMQSNYPRLQLVYLDAGFPFMDGFPLWPHRSHDDGQKVDLTFVYRRSEGGPWLNDAPSWLGYGYVEEPRPGESDQPAACREKGYWQYSLLHRICPPPVSAPSFDEQATRDLLRHLAVDPRVGKIFLEPHLRSRLQLQAYPKIRYHGCRAVRHDDHLHVQL